MWSAGCGVEGDESWESGRQGVKGQRAGAGGTGGESECPLVRLAVNCSDSVSPRVGDRQSDGDLTCSAGRPSVRSQVGTLSLGISRGWLDPALASQWHTTER